MDLPQLPFARWDSLGALGISKGRLGSSFKSSTKSSGLPQCWSKGKKQASQQDKQGRYWRHHSGAEFRISWVKLNLRQYGVCALLYLHTKCLQEFKKAKAKGCWNLVAHLSLCALTCQIVLWVQPSCLVWKFNHYIAHQRLQTVSRCCIREDQGASAFCYIVLCSGGYSWLEIPYSF